MIVVCQERCTPTVTMQYKSGLLKMPAADLRVYLVYTCAQDKIAFFVPLKGKDGAFVLAQSAGQVTCGAEHQC